MKSRLQRQWREATGMKSFPLTSWMIAGSCLFGLALLEHFYTGPLRRQMELAGNAPSHSIFGDNPVSASQSGGNRKRAST